MECTTCWWYEHCYERHTIEKCKGVHYRKAKLFCKKCGIPLKGSSPWKDLCDKCTGDTK